MCALQILGSVLGVLVLWPPTLAWGHPQLQTGSHGRVVQYFFFPVTVIYLIQNKLAGRRAGPPVGGEWMRVSSV